MNKTSPISSKFQNIIKFYKTSGFLQIILYSCLIYLGGLYCLDVFFRIAVVAPYFTGLAILTVILINLHLLIKS